MLVDAPFFVSSFYISIMDRKQYQNEWKKKQRALNTDYAKKQRELKRNRKTLDRRKEIRKEENQKMKDALQMRIYRSKPENKIKQQARYAVRMAIVKGVLDRPKNCEICGAQSFILPNNRPSIRADHYLGYEKENWLNVKFICIDCDAKQLRKHKP